MNTLDKQYQALLQDILDNGVCKEDRTGTGTLSVFGRQIRHRMSEGFPLLTTKKMYWRGIVTELLWFLRGDTNIKYLVDNDCHIWNGDAYKNYEKTVKASIDRATAEGILKGGPDDEYGILSMEGFVQRIKTDAEFAKKWGDLGPVYGKQWRRWIQNVSRDLDRQIDQIANLIRDLKTNPDSRRLMVSAWNVAELDSMTLPPCHYGFQVYTRELDVFERCELSGDGLCAMNEIDWWMNVLDERGIPKRAISLMWNQRSVDTFLGLPFNIASYGLLLTMIADEVNMVPDELIGNLGDTHLYLNHIEQAKEQLNREPYPLPTLNFSWYIDAWTTEEAKKLREDSFDAYIRQMKPSDFILENYQSHPTIKAPLSN